MGCFSHNDYIELTMHFGCNLKCEHCMIEDTMKRLEPESMERLDGLLQENLATRKWKGLILTGAEITLRPDLPELARKARAHGFEHVRIQTHGMRMADEDYCRELVEAGVDEYFVSLTAANAETHDAITEFPGSFDRTLRGLQNLDRFEGVRTLTNTVITRRSYRQLPDIVRRLKDLRRLVQLEFWNYWPMSETDEKGLIASNQEILPFLREAILLARGSGKAVEVKNFPQCLLGDLGDALDNSQSQLLIDPDFWDEFMRNGFYQCVHREQCVSKQCLGLTTAYGKKYGWEADRLTPLTVDPTPASGAPSSRPSTMT